MPFFISLVACALCAIIIIGTVWYCAYRGKQLKQVQQELAQLEPKVQQLKKTEVQVQKHLDKLKVETRATRESFADLESALEQTRTSAQSTIDSHLEQWYQMRHDQYQTALRAQQHILQDTAQNEIAQQQQDLNNQIAATQETLTQIKSEIADWEARRAAINADIMRERQLKEQTDFYRIVLSDDAKADMAVLTQIKPQLKYGHLLDKLIYDAYVAKPAAEMAKRVLNGDAPTGIYKITRMKTGEVYVGKSTDIRKRWLEHVKSCFNVGTIAHSTLHTIMQQDGIDQFTFELLEKCSKDIYSQREKFYIDLYNSKAFGLNEKAGSDS